MSYGCGNYMCRGDPGFFGNVFHAITGVVGGAVKGFIGGGPIGAIGGAIKGAVATTASNIGDATLGAGDLTPTQQSAFLSKQRATHAAALASHAAAGAHHVAALGGYRKRRRMNWANSRALGRAERRIHSAVKHFSKYIRWIHPGRVGHAAPKFAKRRRK